MKLYRLVRDEEQYGTLVLDGDLMKKSLGRKVILNSTLLTESIGEKWPVISGWFHSLYGGTSIEEKPDIYLTEYTWLILSAHAKEQLEPELRLAGEFLPFDCDGQAYFLLVPHHIIPVDADNSKLNLVDGRRRGTAKVVFRNEDVGSHVLFKTDYDNGLNLFCSDKLKKSVEKHQLNGVYFDTELARPIR